MTLTGACALVVVRGGGGGGKEDSTGSDGDVELLAIPRRLFLHERDPDVNANANNHRSSFHNVL